MSKKNKQCDLILIYIFLGIIHFYTYRKTYIEAPIGNVFFLGQQNVSSSFLFSRTIPPIHITYNQFNIISRQKEEGIRYQVVILQFGYNGPMGLYHITQAYLDWVSMEDITHICLCLSVVFRYLKASFVYVILVAYAGVIFFDIYCMYIR